MGENVVGSCIDGSAKPLNTPGTTRIAKLRDAAEPSLR
jgi:hypothetical protein